MTKPKTAQKLVDAYAEIRKLKAALERHDKDFHDGHEAERARRQDAETEAREANAKVGVLEARAREHDLHRPTSDAELVGLAAVVMTEQVVETEARRTLVSELQHRGVLTGNGNRR